MMLQHLPGLLSFRPRHIGPLVGMILAVTACHVDARMASGFSPRFFCVIPENAPEDAAAASGSSEDATSAALSNWPPCDLGDFSADVTIPDGTVVAPGETFVKTWRIRNAGTCTWTSDYWFAFANGNQMAGPHATALTDKPVAPNEEIEVSVTLTAPQKEGQYKGEWTLCNAKKEAFGFGHGMGQLLNIWVKIEVAAATDQP